MSPDEIFTLLTKAKAEASIDYRALALQLAVQYHSAVASGFPNFSSTSGYDGGKQVISGISGYRIIPGHADITALAKAFLDFLEGP